MSLNLETQVVVIGGGPIGLLLALDLAWRNINVVVVEQRAEHEPPSVKCNHVSSRSMEIFRRLGFVEQVRKAGLPDDYPNDVVIRTRATGYELMRIPIPNRLERYTSNIGPDTAWATPEPPHRVNQIYLDPILAEQASNNPRITMLYQHEGLKFTQTEKLVTAQIKDLNSGEIKNLNCSYLIGCEGGRSPVRKQMGSSLQGDAVIQRVQSTYIRAPELLNMIKGKRAWMSYLYSPERAGNLVAIDGKETWLLHNYLLAGEKDFDSVDRDYCIRHLLGVDDDFEYEALSKEDWFGRRLVADKFRQGRVYICGDAAHLWVPYAGYGMNAGIADAMNLSWSLAAYLNGWAGEAMLDIYVNERQPITEQVSRFAMKHAQGAIKERTSVPAELEQDNEEGRLARLQLGEESYKLHVQQFACEGLNYGYYYDQSKIIAYDDEAAPVYTMHDYTPSIVPGCRLPHFFCKDGESLYDKLGDGYSLLRFDETVDLEVLSQLMKEYQIPFKILDIDKQDRLECYSHNLVLSRPDFHIAWRGDTLPEDVVGLVNLISGRNTSHSNQA